MVNPQAVPQVYSPGAVPMDPWATGTGGADVRVFWFLLVPAGVCCLALYLSHATTAAIGVAAAAFTLAVIIAPQIGLYAYFAWQALDAATVQTEYDIFTPAKAFAPFLLLIFLFRVGRSGMPMRVSRPFVVTMLLFGAYGLAGSVLAQEPLKALRFSGQIIVQVLLVVMTLHLLDRRQYVGRLMIATVAGGVVAASLMWITGGVSRHFSRATLGEFANPNTTALALSISLAAIPAAWTYTRRKIFCVAYIVAMPIIVMAMLKTGSRSALMAAVCAFAFGVVFARGAGFWKRATVAVLMTIAIGVVSARVLSSGTLDPRSQARLEEFVHSRGQVGDSRLDIWRESLSAYARSPAIGFGFGNAAYGLQQHRGWYRDPHNSYLGVLLDGGIFGIALFGYALWHLVRRVRRIGPATGAIPAAIMLLLVLVSCLTHTIHFTKWFWVPVTICLLLAEQAHREQRALSAISAPSQPRGRPSMPRAGALPTV